MRTLWVRTQIFRKNNIKQPRDQTTGKQTGTRLLAQQKLVVAVLYTKMRVILSFIMCIFYTCIDRPTDVYEFVRMNYKPLGAIINS